jgi:signal peptidase II
MDVRPSTPYNEKNQSFGSKPSSAATPQIQFQLAPNPLRRASDSAGFATGLPVARLERLPTPMTQPHLMRRFHFLIALSVVLLDRVTKWVVAQNIPLHDGKQVIPGFFRITHVENRGAAFGLFADSPAQWKIAMLVLFSIVALVVVSALLWRNSHAMTTTGIGLALILGGALGNLWDRLLNGRVVDFLLFYVGQYQWPAFNVADSAIVVGAGLLVIEILFAKAPAQETST